METGIYIYGIINGEFNKQIDTKGIDEGNVFVLGYKDITALVSFTFYEEYDPDENNMLAHDNVVREVLEQGYTIIPMRFCTILKDRDDVFKLLNAGYNEFKKNLLRVRDKQEYAIKVFLDIEKFIEKINPEELEEESRKIAKELYEKLKYISEDDILDEQITDDMMMNASFLIKKNTVDKFKELILEFDKQYTDLLKIRISGPLAPYSFVKMPEN